jgi:hypothetical protein
MAHFSFYSPRTPLEADRSRVFLIEFSFYRAHHKQLWVFYNDTGLLHNFHIHQIKFRLTSAKELRDDYHIVPPTLSSTCDPTKECPGPIQGLNGTTRFQSHQEYKYF